MEINRDSWHYKLAGLNEWNEHRCPDICAYRTRIIKEILAASSFLVLISALAWAVGLVLVDTVLCLWFWAVHGIYIPTELAELGLIAICVVSAIYSVVYSVRKIRSGYVVVKSASIMEPVRTMYSSWKDNWCSKVEYK